MAAYIDGGLSPADRTAAEAHIADCARCLELTAAIVQTEPAVVPAPRRSWFRTGWLVPLTAAAVGIAAWGIIRDPTGIHVPALQETIATRAPDPAAPPLLPSESSKAAVPDVQQERKSRSEAAPERGRVLDSVVAGNRAAEQKAQGATSPPPAPDTPAAARAVPPAAPQPALSAQEVAALARDGLVSTRQAAAAMQVIASPDPSVRWRFSGTAVEKTTDGGATWVAQTTGASGFVAGSAPSADVFWLAGKAGLVLLTIDGRTWSRVDLPAPGSDALAITATDGRSAQVTTATGSTYRTTDAGRTWVLQENSAAPF
jgi:hypothetical protein